MFNPLYFVIFEGAPRLYKILPRNTYAVYSAVLPSYGHARMGFGDEVPLPPPYLQLSMNHSLRVKFGKLLSLHVRKHKKQAQKTSTKNKQEKKARMYYHIYLFLFLLCENGVVQFPDIVSFKHVLFVLRNRHNQFINRPVRQFLFIPPANPA